MLITSLTFIISFPVSAAGNTKMGCYTSSEEVIVGDTFNVTVWLNSNETVDSWWVGQLRFNNAYADSVSIDPYWREFYDNGTIDNNAGKITGIQAFINTTVSTTNTTMFNVSFTAVQAGTCDIRLTGAKAYSRGPNVLDTTYDTSILIKSAESPTPPYQPPSSTNQNPLANAGGPYEGSVYQLITFDGSESSDSDGTITGYRWDFDNDGTYDTDWLTTPTTTHSYSSAGTYILKLEVKDDGGATATNTTTATISGEEKSSPVANVNGPYNGLTFQSIIFDGYNSYDPDGTIVSYSWDFGDGKTASGVKPTHSFTAAGVFTINLTVTDNDGLTDNATTTATILLDSDKDGIDDETEKELGSDPKDASDVKLTGIENGYIVDTDGDGTYDTFYNSASGFGTAIGLEDGKYKIDANGDGEWDYTYDPQSGETVPYESEEPSDEFPWPIVILLSIVIVVAVIIFALFKTGYIYIENAPPTETEKKKSEEEKTDLQKKK